MTRPNEITDAADANSPPKELFRRSTREITYATRELTATPAARQPVTISITQIDHPSPAVNEPHATLSYLAIDVTTTPIIAAADYNHELTAFDTRDTIESLLDQSPSWLTVELVAAGDHFASGDVTEFLSSKSQDFIIPWQWNHRLTDYLERTVDDADDEPPNIVWYDADNVPGQFVFLRDHHRENAVTSIRDQYDLFLTRLSKPVDEHEFRELTRTFEVNSYVRSLLDKAVSNGITEDDCLQYLALINYTAAATLSEIAADL